MRSTTLAAVLALTCAIGCGREETTTIMVPGAAVKVRESGDATEWVARTADGDVVTKVQGDTVTVTSREGAVTMNSKGGLAALGAFAYPGATVEKGGDVTTLEMQGMHQATATLVSDDPAEKIVAFYSEKIGPKAVTMSQGGTSTLVGDAPDGSSVSVVVQERDGGGRQILVSTTKKR